MRGRLGGVRAFEDIQPLIWGKLMGNVAFSAVCTVTGLTVGEVLASRDAWSISEALDSINGGVVREAAPLGIPVPVNRVMVSLVRALECKRISAGGS